MIVFADAVHLQDIPVLGCGWIRRYKHHEACSNTGRKRLNINGAIDLDRMDPVARYDDTINTDSTIAVFDPLLVVYAYTACIYVIRNNACYYRSKAHQEYLKDSLAKLAFLSPYARNLSRVERFWELLEKTTLYNRSAIFGALAKASSTTHVCNVIRCTHY